MFGLSPLQTVLAVLAALFVASFIRLRLRVNGIRNSKKRPLQREEQIRRLATPWRRMFLPLRWVGTASEELQERLDLARSDYAEDLLFILETRSGEDDECRYAAGALKHPDLRSFLPAEKAQQAERLLLIRNAQVAMCYICGSPSKTGLSCAEWAIESALGAEVTPEELNWQMTCTLEEVRVKTASFRRRAAEEVVGRQDSEICRLTSAFGVLSHAVKTGADGYTQETLESSALQALRWKIGNIGTLLKRNPLHRPMPDHIRAQLEAVDELFRQLSEYLVSSDLSALRGEWNALAASIRQMLERYDQAVGEVERLSKPAAALLPSA